MLPCFAACLRVFKTVALFLLYDLSFPLKPESGAYMGRRGRRAKTKTVLKTLRQVAKLGSMQNNDF